MKSLRFGIVGCGDIAGYTALLSRLVPQVKLAACCDRNSDRVKHFARRHRIPAAFTEFEQILEKAELDVVYLAVPHHLHYEMILSTVEKGLSVFVEKPLTRTLDEGIQLLPKIQDQKVGVNYQYRYDRGCYALARAVQDGVLGKINSVRINIPWNRASSYFEDSPWHKTIIQAGGGTLITQGSHFLDIALWALGEEPVSAMGYTSNQGFEDVEVDTLTHGIIETSGGTLVSITSSMVANSEQSVSIEVYGERGSACYHDLPRPSVKFEGVRLAKQRPPGWGVHALQRSIYGYAKWVLDDIPYLTPAEDALPALAAVDGIYRSANSGIREIIQYNQKQIN